MNRRLLLELLEVLGLVAAVVGIALLAGLGAALLAGGLATVAVVEIRGDPSPGPTVRREGPGL